MIEKEIEIVNKAGMHTRPASAIVRLAAKYKADFFISKNGFEVNGKSIIGVYANRRRWQGSVTVWYVHC